MSHIQATGFYMIQPSLIKYGALYNWHAVSDARNIAPTGWHIPSKTEWDELISEIGGDSQGSKKLKESGAVYWDHDNGTNDYGFYGRGSGIRRSSDGIFMNLKLFANYWSSTQNPMFGYPAKWILQLLDNSNYSQFNTMGITYGGSVRCLKDDSDDSLGENGWE